jgi:spermidine/putrescine transport system substrate-binding protein
MLTKHSVYATLRPSRKVQHSRGVAMTSEGPLDHLLAAEWSRRRFIGRSMGAGVALAGLGPFLEACAKASVAVANPFPLGSPQHPVLWPIQKDNQPIASGLPPESNTTLKIYNYPDYLDQTTAVTNFQKQYARYHVTVEISTFNDINEALAKLRTGEVDFDLFVPSYDSIGKLVYGNFLRPLNHSYIPNISQVWPQFLNPFYDQEWRYTVPYTIYTTGIGWRSDKVSEDISLRANPYDVFWDHTYNSRIAILDDYREAITMVLLRNGITDILTGSSKKLNMVSAQLTDMISKANPKVNITDYQDIPNGTTAVSQAWSGDMVNAQYNMPAGQSPSVLRYWYPKNGKGAVNEDIFVILRSGKNPVLSHLWLNYMLALKNAKSNAGFTGYQTPHNGIDPNTMVSDGTIPPNLASVVVLPQYFNVGYRELELSPATDVAWHNVWQEFKAGA